MCWFCITHTRTRTRTRTRSRTRTSLYMPDFVTNTKVEVRVFSQYPILVYTSITQEYKKKNTNKSYKLIQKDGNLA
jgi:hypothetical protein